MEEKPEFKNLGVAEITKIVNAENIPSIFCDGFKGVAIHGNVVRINLVEDRFDSKTTEMQRHIIARIVMPLPSAVAFAQAFNKIMEVHQKDTSSSGQSVAMDTEFLHEPKNS